MYRSELEGKKEKDNVQAGGAKYIKGLKTGQRERLLGVKGSREYFWDNDWTKHARGWAWPKPDVKSRISYEMLRRYRAEDGHEIIDKATYSKVTDSFLHAGGVIIRGEEAESHLAKVGGSASYIAGSNIAIIRDDATVSDVLEEMYHAYQDRVRMFGAVSEGKDVTTKREIDAQKYLLSVAKKYKIPVEETEVTKRNLAMYERVLEEGRDR